MNLFVIYKAYNMSTKRQISLEIDLLLQTIVKNRCQYLDNLIKGALFPVSHRWILLFSLEPKEYDVLFNCFGRFPNAFIIFPLSDAKLSASMNFI